MPRSIPVIAFTFGIFLSSDAAAPSTTAHTGGARTGRHCLIRLSPGAESHAVEFKTRCDFQQRRIAVRPTHQVFGLYHTATVSQGKPGDHFTCGRRASRPPVVCHGEASSGAQVTGSFETGAFSCDVASHVRVSGPSGAPVVRRFVHQPSGCA